MIDASKPIDLSWLGRKEKVVFLDRDGTVCYNYHYMKREAQCQLTHRAKEAIDLLKSKGFYLVVVSNQSGIERGYFTWQDLIRLTVRLQELLGWKIDLFLYCPCLNCPCRKPSPYMLEVVKEVTKPKECYMVGDQDLDREAGERAGCETFILGEQWRDLFHVALEISLRGPPTR